MQMLYTIQHSAYTINTGYKMMTKYEKNNSQGQVQFSSTLEQKSILQPKDPKNMPDVYIYMLKGDDVPACYARIKVINYI
jgi:hypothetical protein